MFGDVSDHFLPEEAVCEVVLLELLEEPVELELLFEFWELV